MDRSRQTCCPDAVNRKNGQGLTCATDWNLMPPSAVHVRQQAMQGLSLELSCGICSFAGAFQSGLGRLIDSRLPGTCKGESAIALQSSVDAVQLADAHGVSWSFESCYGIIPVWPAYTSHMSHKYMMRVVAACFAWCRMPRQQASWVISKLQSLPRHLQMRSTTVASWWRLARG